MHPCLDTFMRALPHALRTADPGPGAVVTVEVTGEAGGRWHAERGPGGWEQVAAPSGPPTAVATMDQDTAWRLVTKRRGRDAARRQFPSIPIAGDEPLGAHVLGPVSVMA